MSYKFIDMIEISEIIDIIKEVSESKDLELSQDTPLIGGDCEIDSMGLIQLCIALEEISNSKDFHFDWTSEKALSTTNSIFRTIKTLADEFNKQYKESKKK